MESREELREDETKNLFAEVKEIFAESVVKYQEAMGKSFSDYQTKISEIEEERKRKINEALKLL